MTDLPTDGEHNWGTKLNTFLLSLQALAQEASAVSSVNGRVGAVSLDSSDVGARASDWVPAWTDVTSKPTTFTPATHSHTASSISDSTTVGRAVVTATDAAAARTAIGAGTSSLAIGTSGSTAKAGNYAPAAADISDSTSTGRSVLTAASQSAARTAIGAVAIGTSSTTAKVGNYTPTIADLPAGSTLSVRYTGAVWPSRPTARTDVTVQWIDTTGNAASPAGALSGDVLIQTA